MLGKSELVTFPLITKATVDPSAVMATTDVDGIAVGDGVIVGAVVVVGLGGVEVLVVGVGTLVGAEVGEGEGVGVGANFAKIVYAA